MTRQARSATVGAGSNPVRCPHLRNRHQITTTLSRFSMVELDDKMHGLSRDSPLERRVYRDPDIREGHG